MPNDRHEYKFRLSALDCLTLRARLRAALRPDPHAGPSGRYRVRSVYFDNEDCAALREKLDGVAHREKFRLRWYNGELASLHLEKKVKDGSLGYKLACPLSREEAARLFQGDRAWMPASGRALLVELYAKWNSQGLRPAVMVDYQREPFLFPAGNVRLTLDQDLRQAPFSPDLLDREPVTLPAAPGALLEVKYDQFLPGVVQCLVQLEGRQAGAFSKYAAARGYGAPADEVRFSKALGLF